MEGRKNGCVQRLEIKMKYHPGDVVLCNFPLRQNPAQFTLRPALVMRAYPPDKYALAQITSTDRSDKLQGKWIPMASKLGTEMKLRSDSFINLSNILEVPEYAIHRFLSRCPIMDELEQICEDENIEY